MKLRYLVSLLFLIFIIENTWNSSRLIKKYVKVGDVKIIKKEKCFQNTEIWLTSPRLSNADDLMTDDYVQNQMLNVNPKDTVDGSLHVLGQTFCHKSSSFMNWETLTETSSSKDDFLNSTRILAYRLAFLAIHEHQYKPAQAEANSRYNSQQCHKSSNHTNNATLMHYKVGRFDYECDPGTKFIVTSFPGGQGLGYAIKHLVQGMKIALVTGRVFLVLNNHDPWHMASCNRRDMQCKFLPLSPCVLSEKDLRSATILSTVTGNEDIFKSNIKVIRISANPYQPDPDGMLNALFQLVSSFSQKYNGTKVGNTKKPWNIDDGILQQIRPKFREGWFMERLIFLYLLRPNIQFQNEISKNLENTVPKSFNPNSAIGIPIRASDKCNWESQCMSFDKYMLMLQEFARKRTKQRYPNISNTTHETIYDTVVLTSEDKNVLENHKKYGQNSSFPFKFIVNEEDVGQGSGKPKEYNKGNYTADDVMTSTMMALKLQLLPESIVVSHCSNFHRLLIEYIVLGCGNTRYFEFIHKNDNPEFRLKCNL